MKSVPRGYIEICVLYNSHGKPTVVARGLVGIVFILGHHNQYSDFSGDICLRHPRFVGVFFTEIQNMPMFIPRDWPRLSLTDIPEKDNTYEVQSPERKEKKTKSNMYCCCTVCAHVSTTVVYIFPSFHRKFLLQKTYHYNNSHRDFFFNIARVRPPISWFIVIYELVYTDAVTGIIFTRHEKTIFSPL